MDEMMARTNRPVLTHVLKELGLWGTQVSMVAKSELMVQAALAHLPPDVSRLSDVTQRWAAAMARHRPRVEAAVPLPPAPVPIPPVAAPAPVSQQAGSFIANPAPAVPALRTIPQMVPPSAPTAQAGPPGPQGPTADAFSGYDLKGLNLVAQDCPGSVWRNNLVCLACPEVEDCTDQALRMEARYRERYVAPREVGLTSASILEQERARRETEAATAVQPPALSPDTVPPPTHAPPPEARATVPPPPPPAAQLQPPASLSAAAPSAAAPPPEREKKTRARKPRGEPAAPDYGVPLDPDTGTLPAMSKETAHIVVLLVTRLLVGRVKKKVITFLTVEGKPVVRLTRIEAPKPGIEFPGYTPREMRGIKLREGKDPVWDGKSMHDIELHLNIIWPARPAAA